MLRLKIRHLEVYVTLDETGSQSATAEQLHVTQPALSKWLRELEENAGCPLFERVRPLKLTTYGEVLLSYAQRVLGDSLRTGNELDALRLGNSGHVRVGVLRAVAPILVPKAIARCLEQAPRLRISLYEDSLDNLLPRLLRHELDCVIGRLQGEALNAAVLSEALYEEPVRAVVRPAHPVLARKSITWKDVAELPWILPLPGTPMRVRLEAEFAASGLPLPASAVESVSLLINEKLLQESDMISVVSHQLAEHYAASNALAIVPLEMRQALGPVGLLWVDASPTAAAARFLDAVRFEAAALTRSRTAKARPRAPRGSARSTRQRSAGG